MKRDVEKEDVKISKATPGDLPGILSIQKKAFEAEAKLYNDVSIPPLLESEDEIREAFTREVILKAEQGHVLAGSIRVELRGHVAMLGRLSVDPVFQKQGIGSSLVRACENVFPQADCCELFTGSRSLENIRMYQKIGYNIFEERVLSSQVTLVYMRKLLR
ncbi:MAG: GNAT family N-acetyltransferase [Puniceicoccales bacterium]|jgi:predicted N-acetyltransferase YhbS|nr:GNAT family N-acetyltransferase [Puniceicoccales bacterium]